MRPLIVYDGECPYCLSQMDRIRRWDRRGVFDYAARQTPGLTERFPRLLDGDFNSGMRLVCGQDHLYVGADAVHQIVRRLPGWRWIAWVYRVPIGRTILRGAYAWIAANRMRLGGGHAVCEDCDDGEA